ncbi:MAG TPA: hypothetical protein VF100_12010, partial [Thermoanaerobaculia bacterium]
MARQLSVTLWIASIVATAASAASAAPSPPPPAAPPGELVAAWNEAVLTVAEAEDRFLTLKGLRTAAMLHLAVHDALNAVEPR